ncbi:hypothetical protein ACFPRL_32005 [Pseudoclavibacter helvolus]
MRSSTRSTSTSCTTSRARTSSCRSSLPTLSATARSTATCPCRSARRWSWTTGGASPRGRPWSSLPRHPRPTGTRCGCSARPTKPSGIGASVPPSRPRTRSTSSAPRCVGVGLCGGVPSTRARRSRFPAVGCRSCASSTPAWGRRPRRSPTPTRTNQRGGTGGPRTPLDRSRVHSPRHAGSVPPRRGHR